MTPDAADTSTGAIDAIPLEDFIHTVEALTLDERRVIVDQAIVLLDDVFVHLPLKQAMHAVAPIQALKLIRYRLPNMDDRQFHTAMLSVFIGLRDLHTNYLLPDPYRGKLAFVPFLIEEFFEGDQRQFLVSKLYDTPPDASFAPGVIVTHWNGIPIERAVEVNGGRNAGSNQFARYARGLEGMTIRPLTMSLPPDEAWVDVRYLVGDQAHETRFVWQVTPPPPSAVGNALESDDALVQSSIGIDLQTEIVRRTKKVLFAREAMEVERAMQAYRVEKGEGDHGDPATTSVFPDVFRFKTVTTNHGGFGYIRIFTFNVDNADAFVTEFVRIADLLPQNGLILDVRGNGGGLITAGEKLLQVLTPKTIEPERLHFINTPLTLALCQNIPWLDQWVASIDRSIETGSVYSQGFPLEPQAAYNEIGQAYHGPVLLVIDALCYSTTDIFAAGFQDHEIGKILGTTGNTGAGGANVWTHNLLRQLLPPGSPVQTVPKNAAFRVAIRRTTRVGERVGMPLEDLGVEPDFQHRLTKDDLLNQNKDLIEHAAEILDTL
jgi:C-terminal processing protease CtpA/Prc